MSRQPGIGLDGFRILVAEDNCLVADMVRAILEEAGCQVIGPAPRLAAAMSLIEGQELDGALLDISLYGVNSFAAAWRLQECRVPFAFMSAYPQSLVPGPLSDVPFLAKPLDRRMIVRAVSEFVVP